MQRALTLEGILDHSSLICFSACSSPFLQPWKTSASAVWAPSISMTRCESRQRWSRLIMGTSASLAWADKSAANPRRVDVAAATNMNRAVRDMRCALLQRRKNPQTADIIADDSNQRAAYREVGDNAAEG